MNFNQAIGIAFTLIVPAASLVAASATDRDSLVHAACLMLLFIVALFLWRIQLRRAGMEPRARLRPDDTRLAAVMWGISRGAFLTIYLATGFALIGILGYPTWTPSAEPVTNMNIAEHTLPAEQQLIAETTVLSCHRKSPVTFVDCEVVANGEPVLDLDASDFEVSFDAQFVNVLASTPIAYQPPLNVLILCDRSGSTKRPPFPELTIDAIDAAISVLAKTNANVSVFDFGSKVRELVPWSNAEPSTSFEFPLPPGESQSSLYDAICRAIDSLCEREGRKLILLIADGANNVTSAYDTAGLAAEAKRYGVILHAIGLPTEHHQPTILRKLATGTGGRYLDATTDIEELESAFPGQSRPAYRLVASVPEDAENLRVELKSE